MKNLSQLLKDNQMVELSTEEDVFNVFFSHIRQKFFLQMNGEVVVSSKSLKRIEMGIPSNAEVTDLFLSSLNLQQVLNKLTHLNLGKSGKKILKNLEIGETMQISSGLSVKHVEENLYTIEKV